MWQVIAPLWNYRLILCNYVTIFIFLKDLLRANDYINNELCEQISTNLSSPNKEASADHTHWIFGNKIDSDWVSSPVRCHDNRTIPNCYQSLLLKNVPLLISHFKFLMWVCGISKLLE